MIHLLCKVVPYITFFHNQRGFSMKQAPENLLKKLQAKKPNRNVVFTAVEQLKDEAQIREFFQQYVEWLKSSVEQDPEAVARQNIGYVVGYYNKETADRWMKVLPDVSHPIFGKNIPWGDPKMAYDAGKTRRLV